jgi:hypothetical protein
MGTALLDIIATVQYIHHTRNPRPSIFIRRPAPVLLSRFRSSETRTIQTSDLRKSQFPFNETTNTILFCFHAGVDVRGLPLLRLPQCPQPFPAALDLFARFLPLCPKTTAKVFHQSLQKVIPAQSDSPREKTPALQ